MQTRREFELGSFYRDVATVPASNPRERISRAVQAHLTTIEELCAGIDPRHIIALAARWSEVAAEDLDKATESLDVQRNADARRKETQLWRVSQLLLASTDPDGTRPADRALAAAVSELAESAVVLGNIRDDAFGRRRRLGDVNARMTGHKLVVTFKQNDTFDAAEYETALVTHWLDTDTTADRETIAQTLAAIVGDGRCPTTSSRPID